MRELAAYLYESLDLRPVVIYGGKFQPFHAGHFEIYNKLCREFGEKNVFISTCDIDKSKLKQKAYSDNHIFTFEEKKRIMTEMFGIPSKQIFKASRTPYLPSWKEIPVSGSNYAFITIAGEKDLERFSRLGGEGMHICPYNKDEVLQSCIDHKYYYYVANEKVHLSATQVREYFRSASDEDKRKFFVKVFGKFDEDIYNLVNSRINFVFESAEETINEGGVCGHIQHLYNDLSITFNDLDEIIDLGFSSNLESSVEKVDGQPLAMTYRDGRFLFAYNEAPKTIDELENEFFKDTPKRVYRECCERLISAFENKPKQKLEQWFAGNRLLQMEILSTKMTNMIKYNRDALVFHYMVTYDEKGNAIEKDRELANSIALEIDNASQDIEIIGPPYLKMKDIDFTDVKKGLHKEVESMKKQVGLSGESTLIDYLSKQVQQFLQKEKITVDDKQATVITRKWLGLNKTHQFTEKNYNSDILPLLIKLDEKEGPTRAEKYYNTIKVFITTICAEILKGLQSYVAKDPENGAESMRRVLRDALADLSKSGELGSVSKLQNALARINALGGAESLFPSEGIIFQYKDKIYKITGMFADYITLSQTIRNKMKNNEYVL